MSAIQVENVWKKFRAGRGRHYATVREFLTRHEREVVGNDPRAPIEGWFWAVQDISFEVRPGEVLGLIGANGSGKSTMLKMLTRITRPSRGTLRLEGRVGSLLEVGTGFHPELSGRDNVYFSGAVLGMRKVEIDRQFDEIVEFSGCGPFIDTPVKHYSSGMSVRLAFAVASFLETDILLIDEVLAVGDVEFQRRCLGRMSDVSSSGRTIVFVSHNLAAVKQLCDRAIWLDRGVVKTTGPTGEVISDYLREGASHGGWFEPDVHHDERVTIERAEVLDDRGKANPLQDAAGPLRVRLHYRIHEEIERLSIGFLIASLEGTIIVDVRDSDDPEVPIRRTPGDYVFDASIRGPLFTRGQYALTVYAAIPGEGWLINHRSAMLIDIEDLSQPLDEHGVLRLGVVRPHVDLRTTSSG